MKRQLNAEEREALENAHRYVPNAWPCHAAVLAIDELREALDEAVSILRDWEDYDPDDPECTWGTRREAFLAGHEPGPLLLEVEKLRGKLAGPRCECCSSLCIDLAKDERGFCPSCSTIPEVP